MNTTNYDIDFALLRQLAGMFGAPAQANPGLFGVGFDPRGVSAQRASVLQSIFGNAGNSSWMPGFGLPTTNVQPPRNPYNHWAMINARRAAAGMQPIGPRPPTNNWITGGGSPYEPIGGNWGTGGGLPYVPVTGGGSPYEPWPTAPKIPRFGTKPQYTTDGRLTMGML